MNITLRCRQGESRGKAGTQRVLKKRGFRARQLFLYRTPVCRTRMYCQCATEGREERQLCRIDAHNFV